MQSVGYDRMGIGDFGFMWLWDSVGIPTGFSVGMEWVRGLKSNPHGSPGSQRARFGLIDW